MDERLIQRLESAIARLESISLGSQPQAVAFDAASVSSEPSIVAFEDLVAEYVGKVTDAAGKIGGQVQDITNVVSEAFSAEKELLMRIKQTQKPDARGMAEFLRPLNEKLTEANSMSEGRRSDFFNHLRAASESLTALAWIAYTGKNCGMSMPIGHVEECWQSAEFYSNKVLIEYRNKDPDHVEWVKALKELYVPGLRDFVKTHYPLGPVWSATGATVATSSKPGAPAPPGPPPASLSSSGSSTSSSSQPKKGMAAVFQEISSKPVTAGSFPFTVIDSQFHVSGLRKVTDDMKTKNRADRAGFVSSGEKQVRKSAPAAAKVGPPKLELVMGRKWVVENQIGSKDLVIDECDPRQTVYIFGCKDSVLQIHGKVNNITVDKCTKMGVVFMDVVAAFEIVNCSSVEVQCQSSITTAKASEVNVMVPGDDPAADLVEHALPQQYIHTYKDGQFLTTPVSHSGG
ncbi:Adenylate cyclase-associated CAP [Cynara cardunculus var. scolymus]|uniref:Adenylate cyclase-associated CAP n=1 Tax=Cynara cardunculus var. scolymus TaxID=59895 RepID=A0A103YKI9_CYNCS|nr:Adenylate cyclase-associated CAP [Cynara cardunculus var. scolymus]